MEWFPIASKLFSYAEKLWHRHRFGPRVDLELDWQFVPFGILGKPTTMWRAVRIIATAAKDRELVIASGYFEVRIKGANNFTQINDIAGSLKLPIHIDANRQEQYLFSGSSLAVGIYLQFKEVSLIEIGLNVQDYHHTRIVSKPLEITIAELERRQTSRVE
jgi:hypothetical protein